MRRSGTGGSARLRGWLLVGTALVAGLAAGPLRAQPATPGRVALVIGIGGYAGAPTPAAPNDAGLVAQTLQGAGFDVTAARDLDGEGLRRAFRDFLDKAGAAGPDGIAVVYLAGRAVQADGDNFFVPVDAKLARPADVAIETVRLGDFNHALAALPIEAKVMVVDAAYAGGPAGAAPGLALVEAEQGELVAFNTAPGSVAPATQGPYGTYAQALVRSIGQGGVPVSEIFDRVRLSVDQETGGAEIPWDSDKLTRSFTFFDRGPDAPAVSSAQIPFATLAKRPIRDFPPDQAYDVAIARDTLPAYQEFLAAFPDSPLARRIRLIVAVRREALFWRATLGANSPGAFWTYLARYPQGPHAGDARRRLTRLAAAAAPPPDFRPLAYDVPPPPPGEPVAFDRPVVFVDPGLPPPPPPPVFLLPPPVVVVLPPPPPPRGPRLLPIPRPIPLPGVRPLIDPGVIAPPRGVAGEYGRPRPYRRGPNGDGLVGEDSPERAPTPGSPTPGPTPPPAAQPLSPAPRPPAGRPLPPAGGALPGRPASPRPPTPQPLPAPATPPPVEEAPAPGGRPQAPRSTPLGRPASPQTSAPQPLPAPAAPLPAEEAPAPGDRPQAPRSTPPGRPGHAGRPGGGGPARDRPALPDSGAPDAEPAAPPAAPPAARPRPPRPNPPDAAPPGAEPDTLPQRRPPAPAEAPPHPQGGPRSAPVPDGEPRPGAPPRPERGVPAGEPPGLAPAGPRPPGGERGAPPEGARGPGGQRHPDCGHPGQPACP